MLDGQTVFRYPGREAICGMEVRSDDVYTLGQNRSGDGFAYRKNGDILFSRSTGTVMGQLRNAGDSLCFAFYDKIHSAGGDVERYYSVCEGRVKQVAVRDDIKKVWDAAICNGEICFIASLTGVNYPVLVCGDDMYMLDFPLRATVTSCNFISTKGGDVLIDGVFVMSGGIYTSGLWRKGKRECIFQAGMTVWASCVDDDGISCLLSHYSTGELKISRCGEVCALPEGYTVMGTAPLAMVDGILHVGMTSIDGGSPAIWQDGEIRKLGFNGYISSISVWIP